MQTRRWIRDFLLDRPFRSVDHVIVGQTAPVLMSGKKPIVAVAARASKVHLQHRVSAADQKFAQKKVVPGVARNGAAMRHHDERQMRRSGPGRRRQVGRDRVPSRAGYEMDRMGAKVDRSRSG